MLIGQNVGRTAGVHHQLVALACQIVDGHRHRGVVHVDDQIHALTVEPGARMGGTHVGLVLVIGPDQLDLLAQHRTAEVLDRHARCLHRASACGVGIQPAHVAEHSDLHHVVRNARRVCETA
ncbi:hypothetical protein SDC9_86050 [bioreactor metagenome]|uniref:Uncharacterized protein n=1 Tax=bioreactor metagenome TaxID=1076179 RepID=A0A644ZFD0_9ZZZZ